MEYPRDHSLKHSILRYFRFRPELVQILVLIAMMRFELLEQKTLSSTLLDMPRYHFLDMPQNKRELLNSKAVSFLLHTLYEGSTK